MKSETDIALERLAKASEQLTITAKELVVAIEKHNEILQAMVPINHNFYRDVEVEEPDPKAVSVQEVLDSMSPNQRRVVDYLTGRKR